jgi:hypothetical protein
MNSVCDDPPNSMVDSEIIWILAKRKATAEELEARAESNGYRRGAAQLCSCMGSESTMPDLGYRL